MIDELAKSSAMPTCLRAGRHSGIIMESNFLCSVGPLCPTYWLPLGATLLLDTGSSPV